MLRQLCTHLQQRASAPLRPRCDSKSCRDTDGTVRADPSTAPGTEPGPDLETVRCLARELDAFSSSAAAFAEAYDQVRGTFGLSGVGTHC